MDKVVENTLPMLSDNAQKIVKERYLCAGEKDWGDVCQRVSRFIATADVLYTKDVEKIKETERSLYNDLFQRWFIFNSPTLFNSGLGVEPELLYKPVEEMTLDDYQEIYNQRNEKNMLAACFYLTVENSIRDIYETLQRAALITKVGGGVGFNFSTLSHEGRPLDSGIGVASGPLSFIKLFNESGKAVSQGGRRRGAFLATIDVTHPDIEKFIQAKDADGELSYFNISVLVTDEFMRAVKENQPWSLLDPVTKVEVRRLESARNLWQQIVHSAWLRGDPGLLFFDAINRDAFITGEDIIGTNPCQPADALLLDGDRLRRISDGGENWVSWKTGEREVLELTCNNGLILRFTPEHKVMLEDGSFIEAKDSVGKNLKWGLGNRCPQIKIMDDVLRGFLFGDGFVNGKGHGIGVKLNPENELEVADLLFKYGFHQQDCGDFYCSKNTLSVDVSFLEDRVYNRMIPEDVIYGSSDVVASFLQGLFEANGSCNKAGQISLKSTNREMLSQVQVLLASFGIPSWIVHNKPNVISWHNGDYQSRESYNLQIAGSNGCLFKEKIGFLSARKNSNIREHLKDYKGKLKVVEIKSLGIQEVWDYCMHQAPHHNFCQGIIAANCGEQPLYDKTSCNLGHINLKAFAEDFKGKNSVNFALLIHRSIHYLDNVIDMCWYPIPEITRAVKDYRPIGLGIMGFAHLLFKLGIKYGSQQCLDLIDSIGFRFMIDSILGSSFLARERGSYPKFDEDQRWHNKSTVKRIPLQWAFVLEHCIQHGVRNATVNTIAPTGTVSLIADTSSGLEPVFALTHERKFIDAHGEEQTMVVVDPLYKKAMDADGNLDCFVDAGMVSVEERIAVQSAWQKYIDTGISSTVNLPHDATEEDISKAYVLAWEKGCKGITVFRDGCKGTQILKRIDKQQEEKPKELIKTGIHPSPRPKRAYGVTAETKVACGGLYTIINKDEKGNLIETFLSTSKGGGCRANSEGLSRMISLALRCGIDPKDVIKQLKGIKCPVCQNRKDVEALSCPDAVAVALLEALKESGMEDVPEKASEKLKCPDCGNELQLAEGCVTCPECGWSKCG